MNESSRNFRTIVKYGEYAKAGIPEYYVPHRDDGDRAFYGLRAQRLYRPLPVTDDRALCAQVLPGFRWRPDHLDERPRLEE